MTKDVVLLPQARNLKRLRHCVLELFGPHRFCYVVRGTGLDCLDGVLDGRIAGDHDQGNVVRFLPQVSEELQPRHPRHLEVRDDQLNFAMRERLERLGHTASADCPVAGSKKRVLEQETDSRVIIDVQDRRHRRPGGTGLGTGAGRFPADTRIPEYGTSLFTYAVVKGRGGHDSL